MEETTGARHDGVHGFGGSPECQLCPVCVLLEAVSRSRPEISQHLLAAARELALAMKAVVDDQVEAYDRAQTAAREQLRRAASSWQPDRAAD